MEKIIIELVKQYANQYNKTIKLNINGKEYKIND